MSDKGRIRSWRRSKTDPRIIKPMMQWHGYLTVSLIETKTGRCRTKKIHRLVAEHFVDGFVSGFDVAHCNGIRVDNRAENLSWKTRGDNNRDKSKHGTTGSGLTYQKAEQIRSLYASGSVTHQELASTFGVGRTTIQEILYRKRWVEEERINK